MFNNGGLTMAEYLLGIDAGTESVRTGVFDLKGNILGFGSHPYKTYYKHPAWAEQKVEEWRVALTKSITEAIKASGINPKEVVAIGLDATCCSVVFFDEDNNPARDPIIWMDVRSSEEAKFIESIDDPARGYNGYSKVSAEWFPCKNLWVKKNQPEIYEKTKLIAEYTDWITYELTGEWTLGICTTSVRGYYDNERGGFPREFYKKIGLEDIFEKLPKRVLKLGEVAGTLRKEIAEKTGLTEGIPVAQGGADAMIAVIGLNALKTGQLAYITGSSHLLLGISDKRFHTKGLFGTYPDAIIDGTYLIEGGQTSTGSVLKWFKTNFINKNIEEQAEKEKLSIYEYMDKQAESLPPGSEGVIVLEHWQGNRTPYVDPYSRGVIRGLSLKHTPVHVYRAIMEGVAYGTEVILRTMKKGKFEVKEIIACGGTTNSQLWLRIYADVTGLPIKRTTTSEAAALGSAILGAVAAGKYNSINEAADNMVKFKDTINPNLANHENYKFFIEQYEKTYWALEESAHKISSHIYNLNK
jgi:FGGY-family pentulose kinase